MTAEILLLIALLIITAAAAALSAPVNAVLSLDLGLNVKERCCDTSFEVRSDYALLAKLHSIRIFQRSGSIGKSDDKKRDIPVKCVIDEINKISYDIGIDRLSVTGSAAFGDAAYTALVTGAINILAGAAVSALGASVSGINTCNIDMRPDYSDKFSINIYFECILRATAGNIIIALYNIVKGSKKNAKSDK